LELFFFIITISDHVWIIYLHLNFKFLLSAFLWYNRFTFKQKGAMITSRDILNLECYNYTLSFRSSWFN